MMFPSRLSSRFAWRLIAPLALSALAFSAAALAGSPDITASNSTSDSHSASRLNPCKEGYHQLTIAVTTGPQNVADGDRLWDSHHAYIRRSHRPFLVAYSLSEGPELRNALDPTSAPTGNTTYVLNECYRTSADIIEHWAKTSTEWQDFGAIISWMQRPGTTVVTLHDGVVRNSLWQIGD